MKVSALFIRRAGARFHACDALLSRTRTVRTLMIVAPCLLCLTAEKCERTDPLGTYDAYGVSIASRSVDESPREYVMGSETYKIPRNFLVSVEVYKGKASGIYMDIFLPDFAGLNKENINCLERDTNACRHNIIRIGMGVGTMTSGEQQLKNTEFMRSSDLKTSECGLEYYDDLAPLEYHAGFSYYVKRLNGDIDIMRCPKTGSRSSDSCVVHKNVGDGNSIYYVFHKTHVCQWEEIDTHIMTLISSFRVLGDEK